MNGEWQENIPRIIEKIDECIREGSDEALTLRRLAEQLGYSEYHFSRMFRQVSGMRLREYLRYRRLDDRGGQEMDGSSGQIMAFLNDPAGRICSWGIPLAECWGVRLPLGYTGRVPPGMQLLEVPEGEYIVFEHGPFDPEKENALVEERMETAMREFDYKASGYRLDASPGRVFYFHHDPQRYWKYIRPVKREEPGD